MAAEFDVKRLQELAGIVGSQRELVDNAAALALKQMEAARAVLKQVHAYGEPDEQSVLAVAQMLATNMATAAILRQK